MRLIPLAAAVLALAAPSVAQAQPAPTFEQSVRIAAQAWPNNPCNGQADINWMDDADADKIPSEVGMGVDGWAKGITFYNDGSFVRSSCDVLLRKSLIHKPYRLCDVLVHEMGHLAAIRHTNNGSVMDADGGKWPACHPLLTRRDITIQRVREQLPSQGFTRVWVIHCDRKLSACTAKAPGAKKRRYAIGMGTEPYLQTR